MSKPGQGGPDLAADKARALALTPVARETEKRLDTYVALLLRWQQTTNLIAPSTIPQIWTRHVADSLQFAELAPQATTWVDLGSGGGFPAIPVACVLADKPGAMVHLVESNGKKAAFLREAIRATGVPAQVHAERIEKYVSSVVNSVDAVSARALAPLKTLCDQAFPLIERGAIGLFAKGLDVEAELTEASKCWKIETETVPSKTSPDGCILVHTAPNPDGTLEKLRYEIDFRICMYCGLCVEACPYQAIQCGGTMEDAVYEFDTMYKDKHDLTRLAHEFLRRNGYEYPHGQRAPDSIIELIEVEAKQHPQPLSKGERVVEARTRG